MELQRFEKADYEAIKGWFECEAGRMGLGHPRILWDANKARCDNPDEHFIFAAWHEGDRISVVIVSLEGAGYIGITLVRDPKRKGERIGGSTIGEATIGVLLARPEFASTEVVVGSIQPGNQWSEALAHRLEAQHVPRLDRGESRAYAARVDGNPLPDDWLLGPPRLTTLTARLARIPELG